MYQRAVAENDQIALAIACGDVDGRRDNARKITREEEFEARALIDQENAHPNKQVIRRAAIAVHQRHASSLPPALTTRSQSHGQRSPFSCGSSTIERLKHEWHRSSQAPEIRKRYIRNDPGMEEAMLDDAIHFIDDVHRSVLRNGAKWTINADEVSAKAINPPRTVLAPVSGEHPPIIRSNRSRKEAFTMIFATTASGAKLHPVVIIPAEKCPRAMRPYDHLAKRVLFLRGHRWFGRELWTEYIERVIVPTAPGIPPPSSWTPTPRTSPICPSTQPWSTTSPRCRYQHDRRARCSRTM